MLNHSSPALISYSAFGVRINVETSESLRQYLPSPLVPGAQLREGGKADKIFTLLERRMQGRTLYEAGEKGRPLHLEPTLSEAVKTVEINVQKFVAAAARTFVFVHAGVVGWRERAILIPGKSFTGKSTLVMALLKEGATYYSDEYAVIDARGQVHPFDRTPRLRSETPSGCSASELSALRHSEIPVPLRIGGVISTRYRRTGRWDPRSMSAGETLLTLIENTVGIRKQPQFSLRTLSCALSGASGVCGDRGDSLEVAAQILALSKHLYRNCI